MGIIYLFLNSASALLKLRRLHGGGSSSDGLSRLSVGVNHPPGRFPCALVLDSHESVVEGEVVSYGVLEQKNNKN